MPELDEFAVVASSMAARTVSLSGDSSALLFSALAAINAFWQWTNPGGITQADWDYIQALIDKASYELMTANIGDIIMYAAETAPFYSLPCDGGTYNRVDYPLLYAALDAAYIVDADTFVTPNMESRSPIGSGSGAGLSPYSPNQTAGEENHTLNTGEMPSHQHGLFQSDGLALAPGELPVLIPFLVALGATDLAGGGGSHNTIHPVTAVKFAIVYQ